MKRGRDSAAAAEATAAGNMASAYTVERLPRMTLLYRVVPASAVPRVLQPRSDGADPEEKQFVVPAIPQLHPAERLYTSAAAARSMLKNADAAPGDRLRVLEYQLKCNTHLAVFDGAVAADQVEAMLALQPLVDGWQQSEDTPWIQLREPQALLHLLDDDKKPRVSQQLISDMFTKLQISRQS